MEAFLLSTDSGFSVDDSVRFEPEDRKSMEQVARYILRPPLSLERLTYADGDDEVGYRRKGSNDQAGGEERIDALDFLARVIAQSAAVNSPRSLSESLFESCARPEEEWERESVDTWASEG